MPPKYWPNKLHPWSIWEAENKRFVIVAIAWAPELKEFVVTVRELDGLTMTDWSAYSASVFLGSFTRLDYRFRSPARYKVTGSLEAFKWPS